MTQNASDKINDRAESSKRLVVDEWAYWKLSEACAALQIKHRFGIIAAIDLLHTLSQNYDFREIAEQLEHPLIEAFERGMHLYAEKNQSADSEKPKAKRKPISGGIGSCLALLDPPAKVRKP